MAKQKQNIYESFAWGLGTLIFALILGLKYHATALMWIVGGIIWGIGIGWEAYLYEQDAEETIAPYAVMVVGSAITATWAGIAYSVIK